MAEAVQIPFEGLNQDLKQSLIEIRDLLLQVRDGAKSAQANIQQGAAASVAQQERLNGALQSTVGVIAQLDKGSRSAGTAKIAEDLGRAVPAAQRAAQAVASIGLETKKTAQEADLAARNMGTMRDRANELLGAVKSITPEQRLILQEAIKSAQTFEQLRDIAKQLAVEAAAAGQNFISVFDRLAASRDVLAQTVEKFGELSPQAVKAGDEVRRLRIEAEGVAVAIDRLAGEAPFVSVFDQLRTSRAELERIVETFGALSPEAQAAADKFHTIRNAAEALATSLDKITSGEQPFVSVFDKLGPARAELALMVEQFGELSPQALTAKKAFVDLSAQAEVLEKAIQRATVPQPFVDIRTRLGAANLELRRTIQLFGSVSPEARAAAAEVRKLAVDADAADEAFRSFTEAPIQPQIQGMESLRTQFSAAKNDLAEMIRLYGDGSVQAQVAAQKAGALAHEIDLINKRVNALNPGQKFAAIGQLAQSIAGGFTAIQGVLGLVGSESEEVQRTLLKVQSALAITQGLNAFFGGFTDGLKNIRALLVGVTKAQVASTVATRADVGAKIADGIATEGVAAANVTAATATRSFTAALLTNPIFLAIAALAGLAAILLSTGEEAEDAAERIDKLLGKIDRIRTAFSTALDLETSIDQLQIELEFLESSQTLADERIKAERLYNAELKAVEKQQKFNLVQAQLFRDEVAKLKIGGVTEDEQKEIDKLTDRVEELVDDADKADAKFKLLAEQLRVDLKGIANKRLEDEKRIAAERLKVQQDLNEELRRGAFDAEVQQADPERKLLLAKQEADRLVQILEDRVHRSNELLTGDAKLTEDQERRLANIRLGIQQNYEDAVTALRLDNAKERIALIADANERERLEFEAALKERLEVLRRAGAQEADLRNLQLRERNVFAEKQAAEARSIAERIALAEVEEIVEGGKLSEEAEKAKQIRLLEIKLRFAEVALMRINADGSDEATARIEEAKAFITSLKNDIAAARAGIGDTAIDIFDLLGIDITEKGKAAVKKGLEEVMGLISTMQNLATAEVAQSISATDQIIADRERRLDDLRSRLDQELQLNQQGFASNVDLIREQIAAEEQAAEQDKARRTALLEQQKRIARQQLAIDQVVVASQLAVAAAKVFGKSAEAGIPGVIAAIGVIASMLAAFISFRAKAKAIANDQLKKGGILKGPRHSQGGIKIPGTDQEVEGGEFVVNRRNTVRYRDLIEAINDGDPAAIRKEVAPWVDETITRHLRIEHIVENNFAKAQQQAVEDLLASAGIGLNMGATQTFIDARKEIHEHNSVTQEMSTRALEKKVERATQELQGLREDMASVEVEHDPSGIRTERFNHTTRRVRR